MRVQYTELLSLYYCRFLQSQFAVPEPPSEEEMRLEAEGLERLERDIEYEQWLWQQPDWRCRHCGFMNLAIRSKCRNCGSDSGRES